MRKGITCGNSGTRWAWYSSIPSINLFEIDVMTDVCFGPKNQGLGPKECKERALEALKLVGLKEKYYKSSPFELSGGQKRRGNSRRAGYAA